MCVCVCVQDLRNQLYESYYLNFISAISRSKLEDIASAALAANAVAQVTKVTMVTLNCYSLTTHHRFSSWGYVIAMLD